MSDDVTQQNEPVADPSPEPVAPQPSQEPQAPQEPQKPQEPSVPEDYEFQAPEGGELNKELVDEFKPLAKELGLSQENAQKLVDFQNKAEQKKQENWNNLQQEWMDKSQNDQEFGGQAFEENVAVARKALDTFGNDAFKEFLDFAGAGNHPEVIRFLYRVGKAVDEDKMHKGNASDGPKDPAKILFPNMN